MAKKISKRSIELIHLAAVGGDLLAHTLLLKMYTGLTEGHRLDVIVEDMANEVERALKK